MTFFNVLFPRISFFVVLEKKLRQFHGSFVTEMTQICIFFVPLFSFFLFVYVFYPVLFVYLLYFFSKLVLVI